MKRATVVGGRGFVGRHVAAELRARGYAVDVPARRAAADADLGLVVYAAGRSADYRERAADTFEAHVADLVPLLRAGRFETFVYLSSTRVYDRTPGAQAGEDAPVAVCPADPEDALAASKLAGESLVLTLAGERGRVARLSNVVGAGAAAQTFVQAIVREALAGGVIRLRGAAETERDYVAVEDAARLVADIGERGRTAIYNVAAGRSLANGTLAGWVAAATGARVEVAPGAPLVRRAAIDVSRARAEFGFVARPVETVLPQVVEAHRRALAPAER